MKKLVAMLMLSVTGCFAEEPGEAECPIVEECGWYAKDESTVRPCGGEFDYSSEEHLEQVDGGTVACWVHDTVCVPRGTRAACVPKRCHRTFVTC